MIPETNAAKIANAIMQYVREETKASGVRIGLYPVDFEEFERVEALTNLDPDTRKTLYQIFDTFLRDATAQKAYTA